MKQTKKELEKQIDAIQELIRNYRNETYDKAKEIKELKDKCTKLERNKNRILEEGNSRANFIKHILKIIIGEAKPISKYEVIKDMFLPQIKEEREAENRGYGIGHSHQFLSNNISESGF